MLCRALKYQVKVQTGFWERERKGEREREREREKDKHKDREKRKCEFQREKTWERERDDGQWCLGRDPNKYRIHTLIRIRIPSSSSSHGERFEECLEVTNSWAVADRSGISAVRELVVVCLTSCGWRRWRRRRYGSSWCSNSARGTVSAFVADTFVSCYWCYFCCCYCALCTLFASD